MQDRLKIIILTSSTIGTPSYFVPVIFEQANVEIVAIVVNENKTHNQKNTIKRRFDKIFKIGFLGAINGIRIRKWFGELRDIYLPKNNLVDYCKQHKINLQFTPTINCETTVNYFKQYQADLGISIGNSYIGKKVFSTPTYGMINTHGEVLPDYQNGQSVIWQLYNSSPFTGFTVHKINTKIDQGDILYQEKFDIEFKENLKQTVAFNCALITKKAALGLVKVLNNFTELNKQAKPQGKGNHYTTPTIWQFITILKNHNKLKKLKAKT